MAVKVIDASAAVAIVFFEDDFEATATRLEGHDLAAPSVLRFEVTNACLIKLRRHPQGRETLLQNFERFFDVTINMVPIDEGLAFPNGIVLRPDRKQLLVAES